MARKDYEIGYGKPPKRTQFQPGQSGNPKGRAKGSRGLKTDLAAELDETRTVTFAGKPLKGRTQRLIVKTLATRAAHGDIKAANLLLPLILDVLGIEDRGQGRRELSAQDQAIFDEVFRDAATDPLDGDGPGAASPLTDDGTPDANDDDDDEEKFDG